MQTFTRGYKQYKPYITHTLTHRIAHLVAGFSPKCVFRHIETQYTLAVLACTRICDDADCCLRPEGQISSCRKIQINKNLSIFSVSQSQNHLLYYNTFIIQFNQHIIYIIQTINWLLKIIERSISALRHGQPR